MSQLKWQIEVVDVEDPRRPLCNFVMEGRDARWYDVKRACKRETGAEVSRQELFFDGRRVENIELLQKTCPSESVKLVLRTAERPCECCGRAGQKVRACGGCLAAYYCDETCQKQRWRDHRRVCSIVKEDQSRGSLGRHYPLWMV